MVRFAFALMSRKRFQRITVLRDGFNADYFASEGVPITLQAGENNSFMFIGEGFHFEVELGQVEDIRYNSGNEKEWEIVLADKTSIYVEPEG
jgi:hypothetical protein